MVISCTIHEEAVFTTIYIDTHIQRAILDGGTAESIYREIMDCGNASTRTFIEYIDGGNA